MSTIITNPRRLLNGFTHEVGPFLKCYVLGCYDQANVGRLHTSFGRVDACATHDPARYACAKPFGALVVTETPITIAQAPNVTGGSKVPRRPIVPRLPPTPDALPLPGAARPF